MALLRGIWKLLVGVKDFLVIVFMLLFFGLLYGALSARPEPIGDGVLNLKLAGTIVEQPASASASDLIAANGARLHEYSRQQLVDTLDAAATDSRVKAVALDLDRFLGGGQVALADVGAALDRVRAKGKPVVAFATYYADDGYQLAAHASEVWLDPLGGVALAGPGGSNLYFAGLLEKLGVTAHVYRAGTFKSAVEPYIRNDMSPEARENAQALAGALLQTWRDDVAKARPKAQLDSALKDPLAFARASGGDLAKAALAAGMIDKVAPRRAWDDRLAQLGGKGDEGMSWNAIDYSAFARDVADHPRHAPIGVLTVAGSIVDGRAPLGTAGGDSIAETIATALEDRSLKALVVRVDSPGGSVTASERIRQALLSVRDRKIPVVVSMGNVAASGGYWIATAGNEIVAEPATITGSIGVFGVMPSFEKTLGKLGIGVDGVKTTPLSGEPDLLAGPSPTADALMQSGVDNMYQRFLGIVSEARHKSRAEIDRVAQGRVWDGGSARQLGLVDRFGGMDEAVGRAGDLAGLAKDDRATRLLQQPQSFADRLISMLSSEEPDEAAGPDSLAVIAGRPDRYLAAALAEMRSLLTGPSIQARCLACPLDSSAYSAPNGVAAAARILID